MRSGTHNQHTLPKTPGTYEWLFNNYAADDYMTAKEMSVLLLDIANATGITFTLGTMINLVVYFCSSSVCVNIPYFCVRA